MQHGAQKKEVALAELLQIERSGAAGADAALRLFFRDAQHPQAPGRRQRRRPAAPQRTACATLSVATARARARVCVRLLAYCTVFGPSYPWDAVIHTLNVGYPFFF